MKEKYLGRYIGRVKGSEKGPTVVCFAGVHGNELAGVKALEAVFNSFNNRNFAFRGSFYGIRGNIPAQLEKKRFLDEDLNRIWKTSTIKDISKKRKSELTTEERERNEIYQLIHDLLRVGKGPFYFIDFHTTSSQSLPFITINDALINRKFSQLFPVPIILGIEEFIDGALLSYMNKKGYVSLGFESGQHTDPKAIENSIAFIWLTLVLAGNLNGEDLPDFQKYYRLLQSEARESDRFYEVIQRYALNIDDRFRMYSGFCSFQKVPKGTSLGLHNSEEVIAKKKSILFMPLYQKQGEDAFFLIRVTPLWALRLSTFLRKIRFDSLLVLLPGVSWSSHKKKSLLVDLRVARFFPKSFFHLLGYRNSVKDNTHVLLHNRERSAKTKMYRNEPWYKMPTKQWHSAFSNEKRTKKSSN